jgi:hypothetical protein
MVHDLAVKRTVGRSARPPIANQKPVFSGSPGGGDPPGTEHRWSPRTWHITQPGGSRRRLRSRCCSAWWPQRQRPSRSGIFGFTTRLRRFRTRPLLESGGRPVVDSEGSLIGPGHIGLFRADGSDQASMHFYNGERSGRPTLGSSQKNAAGLARMGKAGGSFQAAARTSDSGRLPPRSRSRRPTGPGRPACRVRGCRDRRPPPAGSPAADQSP